MTSTGIPVLAGIASTVIFAASTLPMLIKAWQTQDLRSYSRGNLVLANLGNGVHSVYVFDLPPGPIWALHSFYLVTSALMLLWSIRYARPGRAGDQGPGGTRNETGRAGRWPRVHTVAGPRPARFR